MSQERTELVKKEDNRRDPIPGHKSPERQVSMKRTEPDRNPGRRNGNLAQ